MSTNPLDAIDERVKGDRVCQQPECALEVCVIGKDRAKLLAALRAVEAVHSEMPRTTLIGPYCTHCISPIDGGPELWPCATLRAITEALG